MEEPHPANSNSSNSSSRSSQWENPMWRSTVRYFQTKIPEHLQARGAAAAVTINIFGEAQPATFSLQSLNLQAAALSMRLITPFIKSSSFPPQAGTQCYCTSLSSAPQYHFLALSPPQQLPTQPNPVLPSTHNCRKSPKYLGPTSFLFPPGLLACQPS